MEVCRSLLPSPCYLRNRPVLESLPSHETLGLGRRYNWKQRVFEPSSLRSFVHSLLVCVARRRQSKTFQIWIYYFIPIGGQFGILVCSVIAMHIMKTSNNPDRYITQIFSVCIWAVPVSVFLLSHMKLACLLLAF